MDRDALLCVLPASRPRPDCGWPGAIGVCDHVTCSELCGGGPLSFTIVQPLLKHFHYF